MEWVETTGKSVDEAKNQALDQLGVAEDDAEIVVIDEPRAGLFGRVRGEARIRARVRPTTPRPKLDRRDRKKGAKGAKGDQAETTSAVESDEPAVPTRSSRSGRTSKGSKASAGSVSSQTQSSDDADAAAEPGERSHSTPRAPRQQRSRRTAPDAHSATSDSGDAFDVFNDDESGQSGESGESVEHQSNERSSRAPAKRGPRGRGDGARATNAVSANSDQANKETIVDAEQVGEEARMFVQGVVDAFGLSGTVAVGRDDDDLEVTVDGGDLGLLVGPRGSTMQALQELTRVAAQRRLGDHDTRLRVDVGGYRVRRKEALTRFAHQVAEQVVADGTAKRLEPMSSADRKVIHDVLAEFEGVATRSEGDDPRRCVVIAPAND
jgi:spoIIIJ-associated protein